MRTLSQISLKIRSCGSLKSPVFVNIPIISCSNLLPCYSNFSMSYCYFSVNRWTPDFEDNDEKKMEEFKKKFKVLIETCLSSCL